MKFLISDAQRERILADATSRLAVDENAGSNITYPIVSLYYDSPERDCYWEKLQGVKSRRKLRVRCYGSEDGDIPPTIFVEVKHKHEGRGVKRRVRMPLEHAMAIGRGEQPPLALRPHEERIVEECLALVHRRRFRPCCVMRYERQAYVGTGEDSDLRLTFDKGIAYRMEHLVPKPDDREFEHFLIEPDQLIMEVKVTGAVPYWLTHAIGQNKCKLLSFSKYCRALSEGDAVLRRMREGPSHTVSMPALPAEPAAFQTFSSLAPA